MESTAKRNLLPFIVCVLCLSSTFTASYLLYCDLYARGGKGKGVPIAKIERMQSEVRRKPAQSFLWSYAEKDTELFRKDSVHVGPDSLAVIEMKDGSILEINANSLFILDDTKELFTGFLKGTFILRKDREDSLIEVDKLGHPRIETLAYRLIAPAPLAEIFAPPRSHGKVSFSWSSAQKASVSLSLQVALDDSFTPKKTRVFPLGNATPTPTTLEMPVGTYYWRLLDAGKPVTEARRFTVVKANPPIPLYPNETVTRNEANTVTFKWTSNTLTRKEKATSHTLEISLDPKFRRLLKSETILKHVGLYRVTGLPDGHIYWRIRSQYPKFAIKSEPLSFLLQSASGMSIHLLSPPERASFEQLPQLRFTWESPADNLHYKLELKQGNSVETVETQSPSWVWNKVRTGEFRWRVIASRKEQVVAESDWNSFSIYSGRPLTLKSPLQNQQLLRWTEPRDFNFEWEADPLVTKNQNSYELQVGADPSFKNAMKRRLSETTLPNRLLVTKNGHYFWRVSIVDGNGTVLKTSAAREFVYDYFPPLAAPAGLKPERAVQWDVTQQKSYPRASWQAVSGATHYEVTIGTTKRGEKLTLSKQRTEKLFLQLGKVSTGSYWWTVCAVDRLKRCGQIANGGDINILRSELHAPRSISAEVE